MVCWFFVARCQNLTAGTEIPCRALVQLWLMSCGGRQEHGEQGVPLPPKLQSLQPLIFFHLFSSSCCCVNAKKTTSKQWKSPFKQHGEDKRNRRKKSLCTEHTLSLSSLSSLFLEGLRLRWVSAALPADPASVSQQRLPHHQRLQRGGGCWANFSQGLLRSPSTKKYAGGGNKVVKMKENTRDSRVGKTKTVWYTDIGWNREEGANVAKTNAVIFCSAHTSANVTESQTNLSPIFLTLIVN